MKIYTEINYEWLDNQLVETSSESFEYEGNLTLCAGGGGGGNVVTNTLDTATKVIKDPLGTLKESVKPITDPIQEHIIDPVIDAIVPDVGEAPAPEEEEEEEDTATGKGTAERTQGYNPSLTIKKKTQGDKGKFTRGSLRVRRPTSTIK